MNKVIEERTKRTEWYRDARFGMFIHWGLYAIPARGEWVRSVEQIPHEDYCHFRVPRLTATETVMRATSMATTSLLKAAILPGLMPMTPVMVLT